MNIEHQDPLWLKKIFFFFICIETLISSFHLIFTTRNIKNDKKIIFCSFYPHLHKILTNYTNSSTTLCLAQKIFWIFIIIYFRKHLNVEQSYCSRISSRIMWNLTHSKYKRTSHHKNNLNFFIFIIAWSKIYNVYVHIYIHIYIY